MRAAPAALAAVLALLALLPAADANWDPATGDYAYIDVPATALPVAGVVTFEGRAGNNMTAPVCGSETNPQATDPQGDYSVGPASGTQTVNVNGENYGPTDDVGNTWVCNDDGSTFEVNVRLWEGPTPSSAVGGVMYWLRFIHVGPGVTYEAWAWQDEFGGWQTYLLAHTSGGQPCEVGQAITAGYAAGPPGGILTYSFDYSDLWLTAPPASDCGTATGGSAVPLDDLINFAAGSAGFMYDPISGVWGYQERDTFPAGASAAPWGLGGGPPPAGPFGPVEFYINGNLEATFNTQNAALLLDDEWVLDVDFDLLSSIDCQFEIMVVYGTASDQLTLPEDGCLPPPPPPVPANPLPASQPRFTEVGEVFTATASAPQQGATAPSVVCTALEDADADNDRLPDACDPDIDNDGLANAADNCPYHGNPDQKDTDGDGRGDACIQALGLDEDRDGVLDTADNCPTRANGRQADFDQDGIGDACDLDLDGDGVPDAVEDPPCRLNPRDWYDQDGDRVCDNADDDIDGDGFTNDVERSAGTDAYDAKDFPRETRLHAQSAALGPGVLGSVLIALGLVGLGVLLILLLGGRKT